jgi:hypothetical protein
VLIDSESAGLDDQRTLSALLVNSNPGRHITLNRGCRVQAAIVRAQATG